MRTSYEEIITLWCIYLFHIVLPWSPSDTHRGISCLYIHSDKWHYEYKDHWRINSNGRKDTRKKKKKIKKPHWRHYSSITVKLVGMYSCTLLILNQFYLFVNYKPKPHTKPPKNGATWIKQLTRKQEECLITHGYLECAIERTWCYSKQTTHKKIRGILDNALVSSMCYKYMVLLKADNPQENKWASKQIKQTEKRRLAPTSVPL